MTVTYDYDKRGQLFSWEENEETGEEFPQRALLPARWKSDYDPMYSEAVQDNVAFDVRKASDAARAAREARIAQAQANELQRLIQAAE